MTRLCSIEGCEGVHFAKGYCNKHYNAICRREYRLALYRTRYHGDPEFRKRCHERAKAAALAKPDGGLSRVNEWREKHPERVREYLRGYKRRYKAEKGCSTSARFRPGRFCKVFANGKTVDAQIHSPAYRYKKQWHVDVTLPWDQVVRFKTAEVELL